ADPVLEAPEQLGRTVRSPLRRRRGIRVGPGEHSDDGSDLRDHPRLRRQPHRGHRRQSLHLQARRELRPGVRRIGGALAREVDTGDGSSALEPTGRCMFLPRPSSYLLRASRLYRPSRPTLPSRHSQHPRPTRPDITLRPPVATLRPPTTTFRASTTTSGTAHQDRNRWMERKVVTDAGEVSPPV